MSVYSECRIRRASALGPQSQGSFRVGAILNSVPEPDQLAIDRCLPGAGDAPALNATEIRGWMLKGDNTSRADRLTRWQHESTVHHRAEQFLDLGAIVEIWKRGLWLWNVQKRTERTPALVDRENEKLV